MSGEFPKILRRAEEASKENRVPKMRTFQESHKSKKTIAALIENNKTKDAPKVCYYAVVRCSLPILKLALLSKLYYFQTTIAGIIIMLNISMVMIPTKYA